MTDFEMIERLRMKADISYEEARDVLEKCNWDLLDAMIHLEREGKVPGSAAYSTRPEGEAKDERGGADTVKRMLRRVGKAIVSGINYLCRNKFEISRKDQVVVAVPVLVVLLLLIYMTWVTLGVLIAGLFLGARYNFRGPDLEKASLNSAMDKAANVAQSIKEDIRRQDEESAD